MSKDKEYQDHGAENISANLEKHHEHHEHLNTEVITEKIESSAKLRSWIMRSVVGFLVLTFFAGMAWGANDLLSHEGQLAPAPLDAPIPPVGVQTIYNDWVLVSYAGVLARRPKLRLETKFDFLNDKDKNADRYKNYIDTIEFTAPGAAPEELERLKETLLFLAPSLDEYLHTAILARDADGHGSKLWEYWDLPEATRDLTQDELREQGLDKLDPPEKGKELEVSPMRETQYGDDIAPLLWALPALDQVTDDVTCTYEYYKCTACGKEEDEQKNPCPDCHAKDAYFCAVCGAEKKDPDAPCKKCGSTDTRIEPIMKLSYRDNYTFTLHIADGDPAAPALFHLETPEQVKAMLAPQLEGIAAIEDVQLALRKARVEVAVSRLADEAGVLTKTFGGLNFKRDIEVTMRLQMDPAFSSAGLVTMKLTLGENTLFSVIYPGVSLTAHSLTMNRRQTQQLSAKFNNPWGQDTNDEKKPYRQACKFAWATSDPTVCVVDKDGYVKSGGPNLFKRIGNAFKKDPNLPTGFGTAVVTASFELDGVTYTDQCTVNVRVSVDKVTLNHRKLKLRPHEDKQLKLDISPKKATDKSAQWFSKDESVAVVDANGLVRGVTPGETEVYAVTNDGNYLATCKVTITGGGN